MALAVCGGIATVVVACLLSSRAYAPGGAQAADSSWGVLAEPVGQSLALGWSCGNTARVDIYSLTGGHLARRCEITLPSAVSALAGTRDGQYLAAVGRHGAYVISTADGTRRRVWPGSGGIPIDLAWCEPPGGEGLHLLLLTAKRLRAGRYLDSRLYLIDPQHPSPPRRLSPEAGYNFWALSVGDVDGDGAQEVALCTWSHTARDPEYANRFFVYGWGSDGDLYPRWRGSRLCRPYSQARLADMNGDEVAELVSVETGLGGGRLVCMYEWNQFGFWGIGRTGEYPAVSEALVADVQPGGRSELVVVTTDRDGNRTPVAYDCRRDALHALSWRVDSLAADEALARISSEGEGDRLVV